MPRSHRVQEGECIASIAARHGFADVQVVWNAPGNAALRRLRQDPWLLLPGDELVIPDPGPKSEAVPLLRRTRIQVKRPQRFLRLRLTDGAGQPLASLPYVVEVAGESIEGETDGDGRLEAELPLSARSATLHADGRVLELVLGALGDPRSLVGAAARLTNLGYLAAPVEREDDPALVQALALFQQDESLEVTGRMDSTTTDRLKQRHGL